MFKKSIYAFATILVISCSGDDSGPPMKDPESTLANVITSPVDSITSSSVLVGGEVVNDGGEEVTERGVVWSEDPEPTVSGNKISVGSGTGVFNVTLDSLAPSTGYYVRTFALNAIGTSYGEEVNFTTKEPEKTLASVMTVLVDSITATTALIQGAVVEDGGDEVTERGFVWGVEPEPTISGNKVVSGSGSGDFSGTLEGLEANTKYYVRAFAQNSIGASYGEQFEFTTSIGFTVSTLEPSRPAFNFMTFKGEVMVEEGVQILENGFVYSTQPDPGLDDNKVVVERDSTSLESMVRLLDPNTTYYVRAYATSESETLFGDTYSFDWWDSETYTGDVALDSQQDMDDFGLSGYTHIDGLFVIGDYTGNITNVDVVNLQGVSQLVSVSGDLRVQNASQLTELNGLVSLEQVGGTLRILGNEMLGRVEGFSNLVSLGGLEVSTNHALLEVSGFENVVETGIVIFRRNDVLNKVEGFTNLERADALSFIFLPSLSAVPEFLNLTTLDSGLSFGYTNLTEIKGFNSLVSGGVGIRNNNVLARINGFSTLETSTQIRLDSNTNLSEVDAFQRITEVNGNVSFTYNFNLSMMNAFSSLETISGNLRVFNSVFTDLSFLSNLTSVGEYILIGFSDSLTHLDDLAKLSSTGGLRIERCSNLERIQLPALTDITGDIFWVNQNAKLSVLEFTALDQFSVTDFSVRSNPLLSDLCSLQPLFTNGYEGAYTVFGNGFNPTVQQMLDGSCRP